MLSIHLSDLIFFSHHGAYDGEHQAGGEFKVDLSVSYTEKKKKFDSIGDILNYEGLFYIVREKMGAPTPLLEAVAQSIITEIHEKYPFVKEINISIFKLQPPIQNFQGKVGITMRKKFDG